MTSLPPREAAWALLCEYTQSNSLRKHALGVEAVMRAYAHRYSGDADRWGMVGLLHDFDYERYPSMEDHPLKGSEILKELGYPDDIRYAILCQPLSRVRAQEPDGQGHPGSGRTGRVYHGRRPGAAEQTRGRRAGLLGKKEAQRQSVCAQRKP